MSQALQSKAPITRPAGVKAKKSMFDKGKSETTFKLKSYSKEEIRVMKRSQLRELAKTFGVTTAGTGGAVADRLISKFEDMRNTVFGRHDFRRLLHILWGCGNDPSEIDLSSPYRS